MFISWMLVMPSFKKSLIEEQFQGNYLNTWEPFILYVRGFIPDFIDADTKKNSYKNYLHREMVL